jgi:Hydrazine synthase alpha subunit middle domain/WD40-like Beta Propeller Repeat
MTQVALMKKYFREITMNRQWIMGAWGCASVALLAGCSGGSTSESSTLTVAGDVPIVYAQRVNTLNANPTSVGGSVPGGDIMIREKSSPSAAEHNITAQFTQGVGDARDPDVSFDGKKIVFAMVCPSSNTSMIGSQPACTGQWNIWEYDMSVGGLTGGTFRRLTNGGGNDVEPSYMPAGKGFVFTSDRQTTSSTQQINGHTYKALDEYERETVFNLHTMDNDGGSITQISVNQSHDRNPTVRPDGNIMFSRWDHVGGRNHFKVFTVKPDGTNMFVLYGSHSEGNSFLNPRDMDPAGSKPGYITSDLMPLSRTHEGGALVYVDVANYSEQDAPAKASVTDAGGPQHQATAQSLNEDGGLSQYGRITTPYPLWDGSDRILASFTPCEVMRQGVGVVSCTTLTAAEMTRLSQTERLTVDVVADPLQANVPPSYSVYMFDPKAQTFLVVAAPPAGKMNVHPAAILARTEPTSTPLTPGDATLAAQNLGLLDVRSIYDTDMLDRMGNSVMTAVDLAAGCTVAIAQTAPADPEDTRSQVADLAKMKDPAQNAYNCAPGRFVRAVRAVAPMQGMTGMRSAIGETEFEMQQILGYAPIEPDGSFKLAVPANTPIGLAVVDSEGRAFQTHTNWIQVRPGERRTCDGCHSPRRGAAINTGAVVNTVPAALLPAMASAHEPGETYADERTRLAGVQGTALVSDMIYTDVWADTSKAGVTGHAAVTLKYTGNPNPANDLVTLAPVNGIINYPDHVAPLWTRDRGSNTCTNCHTDPDKLDLSATIGGDGRVASYDEIMIGDPLLDPTTGLPETVIEEGVLVIARMPALVSTMASEGDALGLTRQSRLAEILWGQTLNAGADAVAAYPSPPSSAPDHSTMLNSAEKRLLAEWIDTGGKYYNDPFNTNGMMREYTGLDEDTFTAQVLPILTKTCAAACHQAIGSTDPNMPNLPVIGTSFRNNRFVLTGDPDGDYGVTLSMIMNACDPASNYLLSKPSTVPHPPGAQGVTTAVLPVGSANYNTIANWIASGCSSSPSAAGRGVASR